jgi:GNAT superfamily N-acetyltransferase
MNVYYTASIAAVMGRAPEMPGDVTVRKIVESDILAMAELYLRSYDPPLAETFDDAVAEMASAFDGTWGVLWPEASPTAWIGEDLVGVVLSVQCPSWEGAPECPWLIDVFTDPGHRRAGVARGLIAVACSVISTAGVARVGLTVDDCNIAACALYKSLGFSEAA